MTSTEGLVLFALVVMLDLLGLLIDLALRLKGLTTITHWVWGGSLPAILFAVAAVAAQFAAGYGLARHFLGDGDW